MNINEWIEYINNGQLDGRMKELYVESSSTMRMRARYVETLNKFGEYFGEKREDIFMFSAPGRTEVCGNHTDHQHGKVLAASINLDAIAVTAVNNDNTVRIKSDDRVIEVIELDEDFSDCLEMRECESGTSKGLIRGVLAGLHQRGYRIGGFDAYVTSDVLIGAGMSSSAAFEGLIGVIVSGLFNDMKIEASTMAMVSQYAENVYFGKPCGLMDQMACCLGGMIYIDFEDTINPIVKKSEADMDAMGLCVCIVDTKGSHADLTNDYASIPAEMRAAALAYGKEYLRELDEEEFFRLLPEKKDMLTDRQVLRAMHFFDEEKRVEKAFLTLTKEDKAGFLEAIRSSGLSSIKYLQNIYSSAKPEEQAVGLALAISERYLDGHGVCRVHGGGFAGTIQAFVEESFADSYKEAIELFLGKDSCHILKIRNAGAVMV